jgi:DNA modification methylase
MHKELDKVYDQCLKVSKDDVIICINIGDATRTINGLFRLFTNGARTVKYFLSKGFTQLPSIIWHKPTNSPNKFMGSGMLPVGAYTTLEHEHILIFRKSKRIFKTAEEIKVDNHPLFFNMSEICGAKIFEKF